MLEQNSALAHRACKMVAFLNHETSNFMLPCMLLSADTMNIFISEPDKV